MLKLKLLTAVVLTVAFSLSTGCSPQAGHPNQINSFDGASYDSLTLAHAALASLRATISTSYPQYKSAFNEAAAGYETAFTAYSNFRNVPATQASAALAISNLTVSIVALEDTLQTDLHVQPNVVRSSRTRAAHVRASLTNKITISDILSELEIAASIAATVPGTQPYATLAQIIIQTTQSALQALNGASGQPIDLSTLTPIAPIS